jgi:hypothetical protein
MSWIQACYLRRYLHGHLVRSLVLGLVKWGIGCLDCFPDCNLLEVIQEDEESINPECVK